MGRAYRTPPPIIPPAPRLPAREPPPLAHPNGDLFWRAVALLLGFAAGYGFALLSEALGW